MVHWLLQSTTAHPNLPSGVVPQGLLNSTEQAHFHRLRTPQRRHTWLLGRWTAKHLVQSYLEQQWGVHTVFEQLTIANASTGAPYAVFDDVVSDIPQLQELKLSISHRHDQAFCALATLDGAEIGADIEWIEPRARCFVEDYFTEREQQLIDCMPVEQQDTYITAIWSAKEAVLKALHLGLTVDTRRICITPHHLITGDWSAIDIYCDKRLTPNGVTAFNGWWRIESGYVLTLAIKYDLASIKCGSGAFINK
ncbi:MAG: 4*-phosphopantetheinyl transferase superfamily protein [Chloroflexi bacterium AL-W]|nr:4*-phosphopantetheinyl transferase superfamily protein [Chloroflexi bacterium AL-N1]NOK66213.1 4*-phosphopantetheinyl transferase superfamily protein [Chloroflexi bacterium AL-N10]NOK73094.1 4*-phosphopantetheinyl transferase superfamily protein [Chloroflexi bacterium AL-N5]NOK79991.1 4*-phosphopantetheinyl transferase superfamily protein [Chloroflexi bacterium AL-W]NOK88153.1 4*-phosphopantetheinyl transferase superfamily protein [Chloroflexi bacterium AL-N15]